MEFSGQASLDQMLSAFDAFLKANGYVYDGEVTILDEEPRPLFQMTAQGPQATDFVVSSNTSVATDVFNYKTSRIPGPSPLCGDDYSHILNFE
jgi:hypothetical protein